MTAIDWAVVCLGYVVGLLLTGISGEFRGIPTGAWVMLASAAIASLIVPRYWRAMPRSRIWLVAGLVGFAASFYVQIRTPAPASTDISRLLAGSSEFAPAQQVEVHGQIASPPRLTRSQKIQFELNATEAIAFSAETSTEPPTTTAAVSETPPAPQPITGKVYVTVPLLQGTGLYPGELVRIRGSLYRPKPATNPGGFDFQHYLARQGIFAGLSGYQVELAAGSSASTAPLWSIRQRISRAQVNGLGVPEGPLLSAMVMGRRAVDVPFDIQDQFKQAGLAHALAASGAQVSMLIGVILSLTQRLPARLRMTLGTGVLLLYIGLTGLEAAVLRAGIMGVIALFALTAERKVRPLGAILFAAVVLLLWQPLWIFDLGFQLSFLATLGLLVTVPVLNRWLDWLPTAIAPLLSVPVAAYVWVFPLQLYAFGIVSPYSILINVLTAPLIMIISIGGMISALAALLHPTLGSLSAETLYYPTTLFIKLAEWGNHLPGNRFAVGAIALSQVLILYGLFVLIWWRPRWHRYWWVAGLVGIALVVLPLGYNVTHLYQATVLATSTDPVLVVQDKGNVGLINSGTETDAQLTLLPFFQKQGINRLQWAIATHLNESNQASWQRLREQITIQTLYSNPLLPTSVASETAPSPQPPSPAQTSAPLLPLATDQPVQLGSATVDMISTNPTALQVQLADQTWLLLNPLPAIEQQAPAIAQLQHSVQVLWWSGEALHPKLLAALNPKVAIASAKSISPATERWLKAHAATIYCTGRDGAIQWTPEQGFKTILESEI